MTLLLQLGYVYLEPTTQPMTTQEIIQKLLVQSAVSHVYKFGGQTLGPTESLDVFQSMIGHIASTGLPAGVVYSAPEGDTRKLMEMTELFRRGHHDESRQSFDQFIDSMVQAGKRMYRQLETIIPTSRLEEYRNWGLRFESQQIPSWISSLKLQFDGLADVKLNPKRVEAVVLSMGERSLAEFVIEPMCDILRTFKGFNFQVLDPLLNVVAKKDQAGFMDLMPDVELSANRLREVISFRRRGRKIHQPSPVFFMPGFYMAIEPGSFGIVTMPFNGSDISAYILSLALGVEPVYIKRIVGALPESTMRLIEIQRGRTTPGTKPSELVADFVLQRLIEEGKPLHIYDTATNERRVIPTRTPVVSG